ncbi:MAG: shikimate kinase [Verrucomicrobiia bacterium]
MHDLRQIENIALIGFMGTGKTSVGHVVAHQLGFRMVDTDDLIQAKTGRRISEIFQSEGEAKFREYEWAVVTELASLHRTVIATGGGLATNPRNLASLKSHALVVSLWASVATIWERVRHQSHRPLLHDPDPQSKIQRLLAEREPCYRQADVLVSTELRSVREVAQQVVHQFQLVRHTTADEVHPENPRS